MTESKLVTLKDNLSVSAKTWASESIQSYEDVTGVTWMYCASKALKQWIVKPPTSSFNIKLDKLSPHSSRYKLLHYETELLRSFSF